jgi:hypothetical protein
MVRLRPAVAEALASLGVEAADDDKPEQLRGRLNERYLEEVRALRQRQQAGEIPLRDYARHVQALKERFAVLGLPVSLWLENST